MCTVTRVDAINENTGINQYGGRVLEDSTNAYIFWAGVNTTYRASSTHNSEIWVRPLNKTTLTLGTAAQIDANNVVGGEAPFDWDSVSVCRLDSGVMIAAYGTSYLGVGDCVHAKESSAVDYATWGSRSAPDNSGANRCCGPMVTDGTHVTLLTQDNNTADIYAWRRSAANTWVAHTTAIGSGKIFDSSGFSSTAPWYNIVPQNRLSEQGNGWMSDENTMVFVMPYANLSTSLTQIRALWTTDKWATSHETTIKDYAGGPDNILSNTIPRMKMGSDGRLRLMWIEQDAVLGYVPCLAYSDDVGQTWTVIGTPTVLGDHEWDPQFDGAFWLDSDDRMYLSVFDSSDASNIKHLLYKGGDSLTGWTLIKECDQLDNALTITNISGASCGAGFVSSNGDFIRVFNGVAPGSYNIIAYLLEEGVTEEGGGPPPLVEESPSGSDATNIVLRNRLSIQRGWSAHDWPFSCFALWPEGDYTTQRRLPTKIAGVSIIDPSVDDPSALAAIYAYDIPEHYGRERFMHAADGTIVPRLDPFYRQAHTKAFAITNGVGVAIVRGVFVRYRRAGAPLTVQIWIDGVLVQTNTLPITGAAGGPDDIFPIKEVFLPLARLSNLGSFCQLRFEDESVYPFAIERVAIKKIDKKQRARNQGL